MIVIIITCAPYIGLLNKTEIYIYAWVIDLYRVFALSFTESNVFIFSNCFGISVNSE